jgi:hypothetical protein
MIPASETYNFNENMFSVCPKTRREEIDTGSDVVLEPFSTFWGIRYRVVSDRGNAESENSVLVQNFPFIFFIDRHLDWFYITFHSRKLALFSYTSSYNMTNALVNGNTGIESSFGSFFPLFSLSFSVF